MTRYEVIRPWHGVRAGDVVELEVLHPSLRASVRPVRSATNVQLVPATPGAGVPAGSGERPDDGDQSEQADNQDLNAPAQAGKRRGRPPKGETASE